MNRAILNYHAVGDGHGAFEPWAISVDRLRAHFAALAAEGWRGVTLAEMLDRPAPDHVVITFDDAYADVLEQAVPIMLDLGWRASIYVPTSHIGARATWLGSPVESNRPIMGAADLRMLDASGFEIGSHSHRHPQLDLLPAGELDDEIRGSRQQLGELLGHEIQGFCYPHGFYSRRVRRAVIRAGYDYACAVNHRLSPENEDIYALSRIIVTSDMDERALLAAIDGKGLRRSPRWLARTAAAGFRAYRRRTARDATPIEAWT